MSSDLTEALLQWYRRHRRDLPWRQTRDPYRIWVSEVMLQQTRVETVIPYYLRWLERFPTVADLAAAPEEEVLKAWEGLGYYSRARNLHRAAREVVARYGGAIPDDPEAFARLPGVGRYTAGAVMSIAFGRPLPAVDGNVLRVMSRLFAVDEPITRPGTRRRVEALVAGFIPADAAGDFNQALMELGATLCLPGAPDCPRCPVAAWCRARAEGRQQELPRREAKAPPRPETVLAGVIEDGGRYLLARRPRAGLLGGLWEFPSVPFAGGAAPEAALAEGLRQRLGVAVAVGGLLTRVEHVFSHRRWDLLAFRCTLAPGSPRPEDREDLRWLSPRELGAVPLPAAFQKVAAALIERGAAL
ncbi:MAG: A/G-specific adenine glycosylase [Bacillota bacterium]